LKKQKSDFSLFNSLKESKKEGKNSLRRVTGININLMIPMKIKRRVKREGKFDLSGDIIPP